MAFSVASNGASSMMAAYMDRQPASGLCAITRLPGRSTRPWVSRTEKIGTSAANIATPSEQRTVIIRLWKSERNVKVLRNRRVQTANRKQRELVLWPGRGLDLLGAQRLIFPGVKQQRPVVAGFEMLHLADKQRVVPGRVAVDYSDHEIRNRALQERNPESLGKPDVQAFRRAARKVVAQNLLVLGQHADAVASGDR